MADLDPLKINALDPLNIGAAPSAPKKKGFLDYAKDLLEGAVKASSAESDLAVAGAGPAAALTAGAVAFPVSGIAGGAKWIASGDVAQAYDTMSQVNEALTPELDPASAKATELLMTPLELLNRGATVAGKKAAEVTGIPVVEPIVGTALEFGGLMAGPAAVKGARRAVAKPYNELVRAGTGLEPVTEIPVKRPVDVVAPPASAWSPEMADFVDRARNAPLALPEGQGFEIVTPKAPEPLPTGAARGASGQIPLEWLRGAQAAPERPAYVPELMQAPKAELRLPPREALERAVQPEPDLVGAMDRGASESALRKALENERIAAIEKGHIEQLEEAVGRVEPSEYLKAVEEAPEPAAEVKVEGAKGLDAEALGYKVEYINKKPKDYYGKHFSDKKTIEIYTKGRTPEQIADTLDHEIGHIIDYQRRGIIADPMGDSIRGYDGELRAAHDGDIYFRDNRKAEADAIRAEFPKTHTAATTQKEIYADAYKIYKRNPERLKEIAPRIYEELDKHLKPVPPEVLKEYPELAPKTEKVMMVDGSVKDQAYFEGMGSAENFNLASAPGEIGTPASKKAAPRTVDWTRELVNEDPIFKAVEEMKRGGGIGREALLRDYDVDTVNELSKRNPGLIKKEGGLGVDVWAQELGYDSGDALVNLLVEKPTKKAAAKAIKEEFAASPMGQKAEIAKKGFVPLDEPITAGKLRKGDQLLIDGEKYKVTKETGAGVTLEDGKIMKVDPFEQIDAEGIRQKGAKPSERGSFSLRFKDDVRDRIKQAIPKGSEAEKVEGMYDRTVDKRAERKAVTYGKVKDTLVRSFVDVSGNLKREAVKADPVLGKEVVMNRELLAGASGRAATLMDEARKAVFDDLRADEAEVLNRVIQSRRIIDIDSYKEGMKHPEGLGGKEHAEYLQALQKADPVLSAKLNDKAKRYFDIQRDQIKQLLDEGIISKESADALMSHEYSPRRFFQYLDPESTYDFGGRKITVPDSGIKALDEGSLNLLENNAEALMAQVISRTQARIFRNRANRSLMELAEKVPDNGIVRMAQAGEDTPGGFEKVKVMVDGQVKEMIMPWEMAQEWVKSDPLINQTLANLVGYISGSKLLRPVATGYNPGFALTNIPRDVALIWTATKEYSAHLPVAAAQMVRDFAAVAPDVMKREGRVREYIDQGGAMNFLTYYGRFSGKGHVGEGLSQLGRILGWVGETSEIWSRMALRERALRNGKTPTEATWEARRYLDFNQGGNIAKGLDTAVPYLNAAIQGTRGLLRGAKQSPGRFTWQMAQLGTVATSLYLANYLTNPECWQNISDRDKEANFIITTPLYFTDDKGQKKHLYFKIAKDQGQRVATSFFEALMAKAFEGKYPTKQMMQAIGDLASVAGVPPTLASAAAYLMNKDTWTNEDVWKGPKVNPEEEYRRDTHPFWVGVGQATGMSPERLSRAAGKIITPNNPFVGLVGGAYKMVTGQMSEDMKDKSMLQIMTEIPTVRRVMSTTNPYTPYKESVDKIKQDETSRRFAQYRDLDSLTDKFLRSQDPADRERLIQFVEKAPPEDQDRLTNRVLKTQKLFKIPDRTWWVNVSELPPEAKAAAFWDRYSKASPQEKERMIELADQVGGFTSERFINRLAELASGKAPGSGPEVDGE